MFYDVALHYVIGVYLMYNAQLASLSAPTVSRGVVALCYGVDNKVPKLIAWRSGNIQIESCKMGNCVEKDLKREMHTQGLSGSILYVLITDKINLHKIAS